MLYEVITVLRVRDPRGRAMLDVPRLRVDHEQVRHRGGPGGHLPELVPRSGERFRIPDRA